MATVARKYTFTVDGNGAFNYTNHTPIDPEHPGNPANKDWVYTHQDTVEVRTDAGPFSIKKIRTDGPDPMPPKDPLGNPDLQGVDDGSGKSFVARVSVEDGMTSAQRVERLQTQDFISKYKYAITVRRAGGDLFDDSQAGTHQC